MRHFLFYALLCVLLAGCAPKIYTAANFSTALARHKTVAILPAEVTMKLRPNEARKISEAQIAEMNSKTAYDIQEKMFGWFLRRGDRFQYTVNFQDVTKTNARLKEAGITYGELKNTDRAKLAQVLGVDAVLQNRVHMEKPMSDGAAIAVGLLVGVWGSTNNVETTINIHDGGSGDLLWKYDYMAAGSVGSSSTKLVDAIMRNATRKFPYTAR